MTNEEKYIAIKQRTGSVSDTLTPYHISVMMIVGYLVALQEKRLVEVPFVTSDSYKSFMSVCEEYDWKPSDSEIDDVVKEYVPKDQWDRFTWLLKEYRDNREGLETQLNK